MILLLAPQLPAKIKISWLGLRVGSFLFIYLFIYLFVYLQKKDRGKIFSCRGPRLKKYLFFGAWHGRSSVSVHENFAEPPGAAFCRGFC